MAEAAIRGAFLPRGSAPSALAWANWLLFYGYVLMLVLAGGWGVVMARWDHRHLLNIDPDTLSQLAEACVLSQYRFLRAMEFGFGLFALIYRREIYTNRRANRLFLAGMGLGIVARLVSLPLDGAPSWLFYGFLGSEAAGIVAIAWYSRSTLERP